MRTHKTPQSLSTVPSELPRLEHQVKPPAMYFLAVDGSRWRILDCVMAGGTLRRTALESPRAICRIFIDRRGGRRLYGRQPREIWKLVPALVQRQLMIASVADTPFAADEPETHF